MLIRWLLAAIHLLAFGFALAPCWREPVHCGGSIPSNSLHANAVGLARVSRRHHVGLTALVLLITGVMRAFGGFEKGGRNCTSRALPPEDDGARADPRSSKFHR